MPRQLLQQATVDSGQLAVAVDSAVTAQRQDSFVATPGVSAMAQLTNAIASTHRNCFLQGLAYGVNATATGNFNFASNKKFVGAGRTKTQVKINDANGANGYIARMVGLGDVEIHDTLFDLNARGNPAQTFLGGFDSGANSVGVAIRNCRFVDGKARPFLYVNGHRWLFEDCDFEDHTDVMLIIAGINPSAQIIFRRCYFTNYSSATSNCCVRLSPRVTAPIFDNCQWANTVSDQFAIEYPTGSSTGAFISGLVVRNCLFDGNDFGGSGVSGPMENGLITGNIFLRGANHHRTGIECVGRNNVITNNIIVDGAILMAEVNPVVETGGYSKAQIVSNNILVVTKNTGAQMRLLDIAGQEGSLVQGNIFDARRVPNVPGTPNLNAITLGLNTNKFCGRLTIADNTMLGPTAAAPFGAIRMNFSQSGSTVSSGIKIRNNSISGWQYALQNDGSGDTDFEFSGNDARGCTTGIQAGAGVPGARFRRFNNTRHDGQLEQADVRTLAAAATYTPNGMGLTNMALTLNGNVSIAEPVDAQIGSELSFTFIQDATGSRTITWDAAFQKAADGAGAASTIGVTKFTKVRASGANSWRQTTGALTFT